jgi:ribonuclease HII
MNHPELNDSKRLSGAKREELREWIEHEAIAWAVALVHEKEIDEINILNASFLAMHRALEQLGRIPTHVLVDGNRFKPYKCIPHTCIVKGDAIFASIAAASILAKTHRDEHMLELHQEFPAYGWNRNKGYPTRVHREAVHTHGPTPHHRRSFRLLNSQMRLDLNESD